PGPSTSSQTTHPCGSNAAAISPERCAIWARTTSGTSWSISTATWAKGIDDAGPPWSGQRRQSTMGAVAPRTRSRSRQRSRRQLLDLAGLSGRPLLEPPGQADAAEHGATACLWHVGPVALRRSALLLRPLVPLLGRLWRPQVVLVRRPEAGQ